MKKAFRRTLACILIVVLSSTALPAELYAVIIESDSHTGVLLPSKVSQLTDRTLAEADNFISRSDDETSFAQQRINGGANIVTEEDASFGILMDAMERCRNSDLKERENTLAKSQGLVAITNSNSTDYLPQDKAIIIACLFYGTGIVSLDDSLVKALTGEQPNANLFALSVNYTADVWGVVEYSAPLEMDSVYFGQCISLLSSFVDFFNHFEALINPHSESTSLQIALSGLQVINDILTIFGFPIPGFGQVLSAIQFSIQIATHLSYQIFYNETIPLYVAERAIAGYSNGGEVAWPQKPIFMSQTDYEQIMNSVDVYCTLQFDFSRGYEPEVVETVDFFYSVLSDGTASITGVKNEDVRKLNIPSTVDGRIVTQIASHAFSDNHVIEEVFFPSSITRINSNAFQRCESLKNIEFSEGLKIIGHSAFYMCPSLIEIFLPASLTELWSIASYWFSPYAPYAPFSGCEGLKNIWVNSGNTAFESVNGVLYTKDLKGLLLYPAGRTELTYDVPNTVEHIGLASFYGCVNLHNVYLPDSVKTIRPRAFQYSSIRSMVLPDSLDDVVFPHSWHLAFANCEQLIDFSYPSSWTDIPYQGFNDTENLLNIQFPDNLINTKPCLDNTAWYRSKPNGLVYAGNVVYGYKGTMPINSSISLSSDTRGIGSRAFTDQARLISITIPESVVNIGDMAFSGCTQLTNVNLPESITNIRQGAFYKCTGLLSVNIPGSVTAINRDVFGGCTSLESVLIPGSVMSIEYQAFRDCTNLESVAIPGSVMSIGTGAFEGCPKLIIICHRDTFAFEYVLNNGLEYKTYYNIVFDANSGIGSTDQWLLEGETLIPPPVQKQGYSVENWTPNLPDCVPQKDTVYSANWKPNTYSIEYVGNGSTSGTTHPSQHQYDLTSVLNKNGYMKNGYRFLGWSCDPLSATPDYCDEQQVNNLTGTNGEIVTFFAVWELAGQIVARHNSSTIIKESQNLVYGLETGITKEKFENEYVSLVGNAQIEYSAVGDSLGTGSTVSLRSNDDNEIVGEYSIIIFGDVTGDGNIDSVDAGMLIDYENFLVSWNSEEHKTLLIAADVNGDGNVDSIDADILIDVENYIMEICQATGISNTRQ